MAKKQNRTNSQNTKARRTTKADRKAIGEANAPSVVPAPKHECIVCQKKVVATLPLHGVRICEECNEIAETELIEVGKCGIEKMGVEDARALLVDVALAWALAEVETEIKENAKQREVNEAGYAGLESAAHVYRCALGITTMKQTARSFAIGHIGWYRTAVYDWFKRRNFADEKARLRIEVKPEAQPKLENREEALEKAAMKKAEIPPIEVDRMIEAIECAIKNWDNEDARKLPDGYKLYKSPGIPTGCKPLVEPAPANIIQWIVLWHPNHANRVTVGMTHMKTGQMEFSGRRGEIRDYMIKVKSPQRLHHPKLGSINEKTNSRSNGEAKTQKGVGVPSGASKLVPVAGD